MKNTGINLLILTTIVLIVLTVLAGLGFSFAPLFYLMCLGQLLLIFTVYKVLTENYTTRKTFDDFYEDHSMEDE